MSKKLWGGRFTKEIDKDFFEFQKSIDYDYKLAKYDLLHSMIHTMALKEADILNATEAKELLSALSEIQEEVREDRFTYDQASEDIHTEIQNRLEYKLKTKDLALKLHSLRSRNDQIAFDEKCYCRSKAKEIKNLIEIVLKTLIVKAISNINKPFIGYTHTQRAQVVLFASYLNAFYSMFARDCNRLIDFLKHFELSVGSGALTGSALSKKNYNDAIKKLKFLESIGVASNALQNVSDRDFVIEFLSIISIIQNHLSRLAEDMILYSTKEYDLINLPEEFCTGSSLMPHKKNPDFPELVRGYTGIINGNLVAILTTMKGLPLSYNRDMQLDKIPLFSSVEIIENELKLMANFIKGISLNEKRIKEILGKDKTIYATEIAEWLVKEQKVPFKNAHDIVGKLVILIDKKNGDMNKIHNLELKRLHPKLNKTILKKIMNPKYAVDSKKTISREIPKIVVGKHA